MPELTKQILIKMTPEMDERIQKKYSEYLTTGNFITKSEFIRCLIDEALNDRELSYDEICLLADFNRDLKNNPYSIWKAPFAGWEHCFASLYKKGLIDERKNNPNFYAITESGEKMLKELPFDQKKHLKIPTPR